MSWQARNDPDALLACSIRWRASVRARGRIERGVRAGRARQPGTAGLSCPLVTPASIILPARALGPHSGAYANRLIL
jgi:hypothetical protein